IEPLIAQIEVQIADGAAFLEYQLYLSDILLRQKTDVEVQIDTLGRIGGSSKKAQQNDEQRQLAEEHWAAPDKGSVLRRQAPAEIQPARKIRCSSQSSSATEPSASMRPAWEIRSACTACGSPHTRWCQSGKSLPSATRR